MFQAPRHAPCRLAGLARELRECTRAELVPSSLALVEASSELSSLLTRLCDNGELLVEASDMGAAVQLLSERGCPLPPGRR